MAKNKAAYGARNSNSASVPCHYAPVGPWRWFRSTRKKTKSGANSDRKWLQCANLGSPGGDLSEWKLYSRLYRPIRKCFTWFGCLLAIFFFEYGPPKDAKTKMDFSWGLPVLSHV